MHQLRFQGLLLGSHLTLQTTSFLLALLLEFLLLLLDRCYLVFGVFELSLRFLEFKLLCFYLVLQLGACLLFSLNLLGELGDL